MRHTTEDFLTVEETASELGLKPKTVYNRKGGTESLRRVKMGRLVRFVRSEVLEHKQNLIDEATRSREMIYGR